MNRVRIMIFDQPVEVAPPTLLRRMRPACVIEKDQGATIGNGVTVEPLCRSQVIKYICNWLL